MKKISVFDTTISDYNLGNQIIMESVYLHLEEIFPDDFFFRLPYMEIKSHTIDYLKRSDLAFFGGTNSLSGNMEKYRQWDLNLYNSFKIKDVILMGIGWWQYEDHVSQYTRFLLKQVLTRKFRHSVRDSHTLGKLAKIGFDNALNTGCPTLWRLSREHCAAIPAKKAEGVVFTFTDYHENLERDRKIFEVLQRSYSKLYYWIQGEGDLEYIKKIAPVNSVILVKPTLKGFDTILESDNIDYVGTRLHAGIRALQKGKRALIIGIDNRALEMQKDFNLPVIHQNDIDKLESMINCPITTSINLPESNIREWKAQFK